MSGDKNKAKRGNLKKILKLVVGLAIILWLPIFGYAIYPYDVIGLLMPAICWIIITSLFVVPWMLEEFVEEKET
ncbi:hypothetical protein CW702_02195 [Candidatus Bathyarchaeota archaeon]|nr:MAG: hypothetical protein CW702_02195 [Candidatus Bathyarchaeota archaeon]